LGKSPHGPPTARFETGQTVKRRLSQRYLDRFGHHYILLMMIVTRLCGSTGGLLVIYYLELTLQLPDAIRFHFRASAIVVVIESCSLTVLIALWETRHVRWALRRINRGLPLESEEARLAGKEAVTFAGRHHLLESWFVPASTLLPVLIYLRFCHNAESAVLINITLTVFMGIAMALMSTFFAVEHCMRPVIRHLLEHGVWIDYRSLPLGSLRFRLSFCSLLIIMTTALMIGTLARQRAGDIIDHPDTQKEAVHNLKTHSVYITVAAVITGVFYATLMAGSVTKRAEILVSAMERVGSGLLSERLMPTGNDEIDILARQFNTMVERLDQDNRTIRDLNLNLEGRVRERTRQLEKLVAELSETQKQLTDYNRQLDAARMEAEHANRSKSEFLANISHELRTPLNGVIGMTDLILNTPLNAQQRKYVQTTKFSGTTLLDLLNEVLDFSKIEAGMLEIEKIPFDLHETIEPVVELMAHRCRDKSLEMAYFVDRAVPSRLMGDPGRLRQVVSNLVNNAIKFTERGSVIVRVAVENSQDKAATLRIAIEDTGIGIPEGQFDRLFQAFSQVDASTTRKYGGTGLGLVICKKLCELMGGQIGFNSEAGRGSTFWFTLPLELSGAIADRSKLEDHKGLRVLVVDQNAHSRAIIKDQLVNWGLDAHAVSGGKEAVRRLHEAAEAQRPYAIAMWDSAVSDLSKEEFATAVKSSPELRGTFLLLLTPLGLLQDPPRLRNIGFSDCVTKPLMQGALADTLTAAVSPIETGKPRPRLGRKKTAEGDAIPRTSRKGVRILLAEDNEINQEVAAEVLIHAGYQCDAVGDGRQALETIKSMQYDLVLMDCHMPELDGLEATRLIREHERAQANPDAKPIPIIALTANALKGEQERCLAAGMSDYLSKPFDPLKLVRTIEAHLEMLDTMDGPPLADADNNAETGVPALAESALTTVSTVQPEFKKPEADTAVLELESLLKRCLGKRDLAEKLVSKLHSRLARDVEEIETAVSTGDAVQLAALAHRLKGAAANLSAEPLCRVAGHLESLGRDGDLNRARTRLAELNFECRRFLKDALPLTPRPPLEPSDAAGSGETTEMETVHARPDCR
jgi:signal transduction histidine kinase/CheY-like chemotaxis protein/HPt (histidine-containing phosphotransfer) domain-containing protein